MLFDTIAAISTPKGEGGIGIIRISGDKSFEILSKIFNTKNPNKNLSDAVPDAQSPYTQLSSGLVVHDKYVEHARSRPFHRKGEVLYPHKYHRHIPYRYIPLHKR